MSQIQKVGILGGTFDPIHMGHLIVAQEALDFYGLDRVVLMPSGHSYFKDHREGPGVLPPDDRLYMTQLAADENPKFICSSLEVERSGNTYTYETLEELRQSYPGREFYFIVGADTIMSIRSWREPQRLFDSCTILSALREDEVSPADFEREREALMRDFGASILTLRIPNIGISSTDIRRRVKDKRSIHYLVPNPVEQYIMKKGLYRS